MKLLQVVASALTGLAIAAALAAVPDIAAPSEENVSPAARPVAATVREQPPGRPGSPDSRLPARPAATTVPADAASTPVERAIAQAIRASAHTAQVPDAAHSVRSIHVAREAGWATAVLVPTDPDALDPAVALAQLRGQRWQVADLGSFEVGCDLAPAGVLRELRLDCN